MWVCILYVWLYDWDMNTEQAYFFLVALSAKQMLICSFNASVIEIRNSTPLLADYFAKYAHSRFIRSFALAFSTTTYL